MMDAETSKHKLNFKGHFGTSPVDPAFMFGNMDRVVMKRKHTKAGICFGAVKKGEAKKSQQTGESAWPEVMQER